MDIAIIAILGVLLVAAVVLYAKTRKQFEEKTIVYEQLKITSAIVEQERNELDGELKGMVARHHDLLVRKTEAETTVVSLKEHQQKLEAENQRILKEREAAWEEKNRYQRMEELARQRISTIEQEMRNWEKTKEQHIEITKASMMEVGGQISSKLLDDHKREAENAKKESEKIVKDTTEELHKKFQNVFESMSTLNDNVAKSKDMADLIHRSLLSPSGAGSLAEITLENIFRNSGLIEDQDYRMQHWIPTADGKGLKPDAIVFLPGNNIMAVDSKASKFFVEIGQNDLGDDKQKELEESLKRTMNQHLKDLTSRNYAEAIEKDTGQNNAMILMFLPSETAVEKLRKIDPKFDEKANKERIVLVGPAGLNNMLLQSRTLISNAKQEQNAQLIINEVRDLLNGLVTLHDLANKMGKSLKSSLNTYDSFAGSFDRTFMSKAKKIEKLGTQMPKIRDIKRLERYNIEVKTSNKEIEADFFEDEPAESDNVLPLLAVEG